jgi:uncharacterized membrane protein
MKRRSTRALRQMARRPNSAAMKQRTRKAIGTFSVVVFIIAYSLIMMAVGGELAVGRGLAVEIIFYAVAGLLWLPVVMAIIRWMVRPDPA